MTQQTEQTKAVDPTHFATFADGEGRHYTLALPIRRFYSLRDALGVDFREATVLAELRRVLADAELLVNVITHLVGDQFAALDIDADGFSDAMWPIIDDDTVHPLTVAGEALSQVVAGFIRNPLIRKNLLRQIGVEKSSTDELLERSLSELDSVEPGDVAGKLHDRLTGGKPFMDRLDEVLQASEPAESNELSGAAQAVSE